MTAFLEESTPDVDLFVVDKALVRIGSSGTRSWMSAFNTLCGVSIYIGAHSTAGESHRHVAPATFRALLHRDSNVNELSQKVDRSLRLPKDCRPIERECCGRRPMQTVEPNFSDLLSVSGPLGAANGTRLNSNWRACWLSSCVWTRSAVPPKRGRVTPRRHCPPPT